PTSLSPTPPALQRYLVEPAAGRPRKPLIVEVSTGPGPLSCAGERCSTGRYLHDQQGWARGRGQRESAAGSGRGGGWAGAGRYRRRCRWKAWSVLVGRALIGDQRSGTGARSSAGRRRAGKHGPVVRLNGRLAGRRGGLPDTRRPIGASVRCVAG